MWFNINYDMIYTLHSLQVSYYIMRFVMFMCIFGLVFHREVYPLFHFRFKHKFCGPYIFEPSEAGISCFRTSVVSAYCMIQKNARQ